MGWNCSLARCFLPVVIHILYLSLDVAVNALAVGAVCELPHHAQAIRPFLSGKKLLDRNNNALPTPLSVNTHDLLPQGHLWWSRSSFFGFTPPSLQRSEIKGRSMSSSDSALSFRTNFQLKQHRQLESQTYTGCLSFYILLFIFSIIFRFLETLV